MPKKRAAKTKVIEFLQNDNEPFRLYNPSTFEEDVEAFRNQSNRLRAALDALLMEGCGFSHRVVQHRDGNLPWCPRCGRSSMGLVIKDLEQL